MSIPSHFLTASLNVKRIRPDGGKNWTKSLPFENRFSFFQESGDAFFFDFGGEADGEEVDLTAEAFVEVGAGGEFDCFF